MTNPLSSEKPYSKFDPANPPPPLMTGELDSFAQRTMQSRIPAIIKQVLADFDRKYPPEIKQNLQELYDEITLNRLIQPLDTAGPDEASWSEAYRPYAGKSWLDIPWYFAESFFYRRLLEATGYFGGHDIYWQGNDPFVPRKVAELEGDEPWQALATALDRAATDSAASFRTLLHHCVWGNRIDLSYSKVAESTGRTIVVDNEQANLLVDDTEVVLAHLNQGRGLVTSEGIGDNLGLTGLTNQLVVGRQLCIEFVCDNSGTELLMDLALADFLLRFNWAKQVVLHLKAHPTFVSDAVAKDIDLTVTAIKNYPRIELSPLATRLESYRRQGRLTLEANLFWNSSRFFWEMPEPLTNRLAQAHLIIIKGDANYRRLLGDSRWLATVPLAAAVPYFPAPFVALRTMKSDPVVGLKPGQAQALDQADNEWRVNGKRGLIQALL